MHPIVYVAVFAVVTTLVVFLAGIRIVRPTHRGLVERLGKYRRFANRGFNWIIPVIDRLVQVNITEQMVNAQPQEIITNDNLNARVDAQVYFRVQEDEESVKTPNTTSTSINGRSSISLVRRSETSSAH